MHNQRVQTWIEGAERINGHVEDRTLNDDIRRAVTSIQGCNLSRTLDTYFKLRTDVESAVGNADVDERTGGELGALVDTAPDAILNSLLICTDNSVEREFDTGFLTRMTPPDER